MTSGSAILEWFRGWHRAYKFAVLLVAAWAPFLFPESPALTSVVMAIGTILFFVVTGPMHTDRKTGSTQERENRDPNS